MKKSLFAAALDWMQQYPFYTYLILCFILFLGLLSMLPRQYFTDYRHAKRND